MMKRLTQSHWRNTAWARRPRLCRKPIQKLSTGLESGACRTTTRCWFETCTTTSSLSIFSHNNPSCTTVFPRLLRVQSATRPARISDTVLRTKNSHCWKAALKTAHSRRRWRMKSSKFAPKLWAIPRSWQQFTKKLTLTIQLLKAALTCFSPKKYVAPAKK